MINKEKIIKEHVFVMDWIREITDNNEIEGRITVDEDQLKSIMKDYAQQKCKEQRGLVRDEIRECIDDKLNKTPTSSEDAIFNKLLESVKGEFCRMCIYAPEPEFN